MPMELPSESLHGSDLITALKETFATSSEVENGKKDKISKRPKTTKSKKRKRQEIEDDSDVKLFEVQPKKKKRKTVKKPKSKVATNGVKGKGPMNPEEDFPEEETLVIPDPSSNVGVVAPMDIDGETEPKRSKTQNDDIEMENADHSNNTNNKHSSTSNIPTLRSDVEEDNPYHYEYKPSVVEIKAKGQSYVVELEKLLGRELFNILPNFANTFRKRLKDNFDAEISTFQLLSGNGKDNAIVESLKVLFSFFTSKNFFSVYGFLMEKWQLMSFKQLVDLVPLVPSLIAHCESDPLSLLDTSGKSLTMMKMKPKEVMQLLFCKIIKHALPPRFAIFVSDEIDFYRNYRTNVPVSNVYCHYILVFTVIEDYLQRKFDNIEPFGITEWIKSDVECKKLADHIVIDSQDYYEIISCIRRVIILAKWWREADTYCNNILAKVILCSLLTMLRYFDYTVDEKILKRIFNKEFTGVKDALSDAMFCAVDQEPSKKTRRSKKDEDKEMDELPSLGFYSLYPFMKITTSTNYGGFELAKYAKRLENCQTGIENVKEIPVKNMDKQIESFFGVSKNAEYKRCLSIKKPSTVLSILILNNFIVKQARIWNSLSVNEACTLQNERGVIDLVLWRNKFLLPHRQEVMVESVNILKKLVLSSTYSDSVDVLYKSKLVKDNTLFVLEENDVELTVTDLVVVDGKSKPIDVKTLHPVCRKFGQIFDICFRKRKEDEGRIKIKDIWRVLKKYCSSNSFDYLSRNDKSIIKKYLKPYGKRGRTYDLQIVDEYKENV